MSRPVGGRRGSSVCLLRSVGLLTSLCYFVVEGLVVAFAVGGGVGGRISLRCLNKDLSFYYFFSLCD